MKFLDVIVPLFAPGDSTTIILTVGLILVALVCGATATLLALHFQKERKREEKRREKQTANESEE